MRISIPATWNDLSDSQLSAMAQLMHSGTVGLKFDYRAWRILFSYRWWQFRRYVQNIRILNQVPISHIEIVNDQAVERGLKSHYEFIYKRTDRTKFPSGIKDNSGKEYYPPLPAIANISADEFAFADDLFDGFQKTADFEYLQMLVAVLYSPTHPQRSEFNKDALPHLSDSFSKLSRSKLLAVKIAYSGSRFGLEKRFPKAFPKSSAAEKKAGKKYGFAKVILQMCNKDLSKRREIGRINIYTFLEQFEQDITDAKPMK